MSHFIRDRLIIEKETEKPLKSRRDREAENLTGGSKTNTKKKENIPKESTSSRSRATRHTDDEEIETKSKPRKVKLIIYFIKIINCLLQNIYLYCVVIYM